MLSPECLSTPLPSSMGTDEPVRASIRHKSVAVAPVGNSSSRRAVTVTVSDECGITGPYIVSRMSGAIFAAAMLLAVPGVPPIGALAAQFCP
jgi:hypothetical protein